MALYPTMRSGSSVLTTVEADFEELEGNLAVGESSGMPMVPITPSLKIGPRTAGPLMMEKFYTLEFSEWIEYQWSFSSRHGLLCWLDEDLTEGVNDGFTEVENILPVSPGSLGGNLIIHSAFSATQPANDLYDFCIRHDLSVYLSVAIGLIRDSFPSIKRLRLQLERDPDIEEEWILIDFDAEGEVEKILDEYDRYTDRWVKAAPWPERDRIRTSFNIE